MIAILGLLGLALAGTAFVGLNDDSDVPADDAFETARDPSDGDGADVQSVAADEDTDAQETTEQDADGQVIYGDLLDDTLVGGAGPDYIDGVDGNDTLTGHAGDDQLHGGAGNDTIDGADGADLIYGYIGDDVLSGGAGDDKLHGGDGDDLIEGGYDDDELLGGHGDDTLIGGMGADVLQGSGGDDVIDGLTGEDSATADYLNGGEGNDTLIANDGDILSGGTGADKFNIANGAVTIMDYTPEDVLILDYTGDAPVLSTELNESGLTLLANGTPVADLFGLAAFDITSVQLVAA